MCRLPFLRLPSVVGIGLVVARNRSNRGFSALARAALRYALV